MPRNSQDMHLVQCVNKGVSRNVGLVVGYLQSFRYNNTKIIFITHLYLFACIFQSYRKSESLSNIQKLKNDKNLVNGIIKNLPEHYADQVSEKHVKCKAPKIKVFGYVFLVGLHRNIPYNYYVHTHVHVLMKDLQTLFS